MTTISRTSRKQSAQWKAYMASAYLQDSKISTTEFGIIDSAACTLSDITQKH